jgi:glycosyltransferase involved in cell wall biosynthesis
MKINFVTYLYWPPHFGGELKISIERFESLVKRGHSVTVLTSGVPGYSDNEVINGVHIKRSPIIHNSRFGRGIRRLLFPIWSSCQIRRMKLDILHYGGMGGIEPITNRLSMQWLNHLAHV